MSISSVLAISNSVFFSAYLLQPRKRSLPNFLLASLLIALALRILKSLTAVVFVDTSSFLLALGLGSMGTIGPVLYLYIKSFIKENPVEIKTMHFILPVVMAVVSFSENQLMIYILYVFIVIQIFVYIVKAIKFSLRQTFEFEAKKVLWIKVLIGAVFIIWLTMLLQLIFDNSHTYVLTSTIAALLIYMLGFVGFNNSKLFLNRDRIAIDHDLYLDVSDKFHAILEEENIYKTPKITLSKVAKRLAVPAYLVSRSINVVDGKTFPEIIKEYRLRDIKQNLKDPDNLLVSIDALAYEVGFISLSKFYALFKKETGLTPDQYRKSDFQ